MNRPSRTPRADLTERPSKSQLKRDMLAVQDLGESLVKLSDERLESLHLPERLMDAIQLVRRIRAHEGRRRQMQFIGRLMREEADIEAIRRVLEDEHHQHRVDTALMHEAERWREALLDEPGGLDRWLNAWPDSRKAIEPLVAAARAELAGGVRGRHYRELFRLLRDTLMQAAARSAAGGSLEVAGEQDEALAPGTEQSGHD